MIQEQARTFASRLKIEDFSIDLTTNGWLARFKTRHNISAASVSGERGSVDPLTVEAWKNRLPQVTKGYAPRDIYNLDEKRLFFVPYLKKPLLLKEAIVQEGRSLKKD